MRNLNTRWVAVVAGCAIACSTVVEPAAAQEPPEPVVTEREAAAAGETEGAEQNTAEEHATTEAADGGLQHGIFVRVLGDITHTMLPANVHVEETNQESGWLRTASGVDLSVGWSGRRGERIFEVGVEAGVGTFDGNLGFAFRLGLGMRHLLMRAGIASLGYQLALKWAAAEHEVGGGTHDENIWTITLGPTGEIGLDAGRRWSVAATLGATLLVVNPAKKPSSLAPALQVGTSVIWRP